jgi:hypothetical protein
MMMHLGGAGGRTQADQKAQSQDRTHRMCSTQPPRDSYVVRRRTAPIGCGFTINHIGGIVSARPEKFAFAEMRAPSLRELLAVASSAAIRRTTPLDGRKA